MALAFTNKKTTQIKARVNGTTDNVTFNGCTADPALTPADAASQINKLLAIVGKSISADKNMTRSQIQEVTE